MRFALVLASVIVTHVGCSGPTSQSFTAPDSPIPAQPRELGDLAGMVIDERDYCIVGATVVVVRGQRAGERVEQVIPCNKWDAAVGFEFSGVVAGVEMTLLATAQSYAAAEDTFVPFSRGVEHELNVFLTLSKIQ
jgi:hypothetical protein